MIGPPQSLVVGLGESLFDCFGDREVLGGAPLNVAVHAAALLRPFGGGAAVATRIGCDDLGNRLLRELDERGVDTRFVQRDERLPTGSVEVSINSEGDADYHFLTPSAWDALEPSEAFDDLATRCAAVVFGTLGQRADASRSAIEAFLLNAPQAVRLFDLNLRQEYYSAELIHRSLDLASAAKLNEEEAETLSNLLDFDTNSSLDDIAASLIDRHQLDWLAITRGRRGTLLRTPDARHEGEPIRFDPHPEVDNVGAGDACSAGLLFGALQGWPPDRTVALANRLGAYVASQPGATPELPETL